MMSADGKKSVSGGKPAAFTSREDEIARLNAAMSDDPAVRAAFEMDAQGGDIQFSNLEIDLKAMREHDPRTHPEQQHGQVWGPYQGAKPSIADPDYKHGGGQSQAQKLGGRGAQRQAPKPIRRTPPA
ncbi:MAG: hypothetical protein HOQ05_05655 [Corynebacteriales bacterium]|nr:hypothetical protein [Mycobacteriales bacterium]